MTATLTRSWPELTAGRKNEAAWQWPLHDHAFLVRLDGEVLYGGLFVHVVAEPAERIARPVGAFGGGGLVIANPTRWLGF